MQQSATAAPCSGFAYAEELTRASNMFCGHDTSGALQPRRSLVEQQLPLSLHQQTRPVGLAVHLAEAPGLAVQPAALQPTSVADQCLRQSPTAAQDWRHELVAESLILPETGEIVGWPPPPPTGIYLGNVLQNRIERLLSNYKRVEVIGGT